MKVRVFLSKPSKSCFVPPNPESRKTLVCAFSFFLKNSKKSPLSSSARHTDLRGRRRGLLSPKTSQKNKVSYPNSHYNLYLIISALKFLSQLLVSQVFQHKRHSIISFSLFLFQLLFQIFFFIQCLQYLLQMLSSKCLPSLLIHSLVAHLIASHTCLFPSIA